MAGYASSIYETEVEIDYKVVAAPAKPKMLNAPIESSITIETQILDPIVDAPIHQEVIVDAPMHPEIVEDL